jgi:hypothetical protein
VEESVPQAHQDPNQSLLNLASESWRFARLFYRVLDKLDAGEAPKYVSQLRYFVKRIEESLEAENMKLVNLEGHPYDPGIAATALNIADFGPEDRLYVDQMVEPIVMGPQGIVKAGTVLLKKAD